MRKVLVIWITLLALSLLTSCSGADSEKSE